MKAAEISRVCQQKHFTCSEKRFDERANEKAAAPGFSASADHPANAKSLSCQFVQPMAVTSNLTSHETDGRMLFTLARPAFH